MRICFVSPGVLYTKDRKFHQQGSESVILGISRQLVKMGHEVYITGRFNEFKDDQKEIEGIHFLNIKSQDLRDHKLDEIGSALLYSKKVSKLLINMDLDVLSLNERFSAYYPSKLNIPKIFTTHNPDAMGFYRKFAIKNNPINLFFFDIKKRFEESVLSNSNRIVALNGNVKDYLNNKGFKNIDIIPNAINPNEYSDQGNGNFILYTGRLSKVKGINYLIKAFLELGTEFEDTELLIVGSGPEEKQLKENLKGHKFENKIKFIPMLNKTKLKEYLSRCSVLVLPSLFETFGIVLIEAMASGKPVIASNIPGPNEIIENGYNGFLFEKENHKELTNCLKLLLSDNSLQKKIGKNAKKTVEERYTFEKVAEEYLNVFNKILKQ